MGFRKLSTCVGDKKNMLRKHCHAKHGTTIYSDIACDRLGKTVLILQNINFTSQPRMHNTCISFPVHNDPPVHTHINTPHKPHTKNARQRKNITGQKGLHVCLHASRRQTNVGPLKGGGDCCLKLPPRGDSLRGVKRKEGRPEASREVGGRLRHAALRTRDLGGVAAQEVVHRLVHEEKKNSRTMRGRQQRQLQMYECKQQPTSLSVQGHARRGGSWSSASLESSFRRARSA